MRQFMMRRLCNLAVCLLLLACVLPVDFVFDSNSVMRPVSSIEGETVQSQRLPAKMFHLARSTTLRSFLNTSRFDSPALPKFTRTLYRLTVPSSATGQINKRTASGSRLLDRWSMVFGSLAALSPVLLC